MQIMNKQQERNNVFGTVLTDALPASNYRGDTEDNRSILQTLKYADGEHTVFSAESIRNRLREMLREDGLKSNRSRLKSQRELTVHYDEFPNAREFADDKLFGFLALSNKEGKEFQGESALRVNYAVSIEPFSQRSTMHQSPVIKDSPFKNAGSSGIIYREVHVTAYQYPFGLNLNDFRDDKPEQEKKWKKWAAHLLRAIGELNGVAGNHARTMFPFGPVSIILRLTARRTPDFDLYGFKLKSEDSQRELLDSLRNGELKGEDFYIGGRIVKDNEELKALAHQQEEARKNTDKKAVLEGTGLSKANLFSSATEAINALIKGAGLETEA